MYTSMYTSNVHQAMSSFILPPDGDTLPPFYLSSICQEGWTFYNSSEPSLRAPGVIQRITQMLQFVCTAVSYSGGQPEFPVVSLFLELHTAPCFLITIPISTPREAPCSHWSSTRTIWIPDNQWDASWWGCIRSYLLGYWLPHIFHRGLTVLKPTKWKF